MLDGQTEVAEFYAGTFSVAICDCALGTLPSLDCFHIWHSHVSNGTTSL